MRKNENYFLEGDNFETDVNTFFHPTDIKLMGRNIHILKR